MGRNLQIHETRAVSPASSVYAFYITATDAKGSETRRLGPQTYRVQRVTYRGGGVCLPAHLSVIGSIVLPFTFHLSPFTSDTSWPRSAPPGHPSRIC